MVHPDGRLETHSYEFGTYGPPGADGPGTFSPGEGTDLRETIVHGTAASPGGIAYRTTTAVRITDRLGNLLQEETWVHTDAGEERIGWVVYTRDAFGRLLSTRRSDGTAVENTWACCGKASGTDADGTRTEYTHDGLGRVLEATRYAANGTLTTPPTATTLKAGSSRKRAPTVS